MSVARTLILLCSLAAPAAAQDTAGAWAPTFTSRHSGWDVTCDARGDGREREERCYLRYVDVYAPRPNFGALFLFLEIRDGAPRLSLGREFETDLEASLLRVADGWDRPEGLCTGGPCAFEGATAEAFIDAMRAGGTLEIGFTDATGMDRLRRWSSDGFAKAVEDVLREADARGL